MTRFNSNGTLEPCPVLRQLDWGSGDDTLGDFRIDRSFMYFTNSDPAHPDRNSVLQNSIQIQTQRSARAMIIASTTTALSVARVTELQVDRLQLLVAGSR